MELSQQSSNSVLDQYDKFSSIYLDRKNRKKKKQENIFRKITMMAGQQQRLESSFADSCSGEYINHHHHHHHHHHHSLKDSSDSTCSTSSTSSSTNNNNNNNRCSGCFYKNNNSNSPCDYFISASSQKQFTGCGSCCNSQKSTPNISGNFICRDHHIDENDIEEDSDSDNDSHDGSNHHSAQQHEEDDVSLDGCMQMDIDSWYSGDPLVSEVLKDIKETVTFMERRAMELESVEKTICTLNETREAIRKDIKLKKQFLKQIQNKKEEHIKTITKSYNSLAIRYNLSQMESRSLTLILPEEVMLHIFKFLSPMDLCSGVCRVSRKWRALAFDISLWRDICLQRKLLDGSSFDKHQNRLFNSKLSHSQSSDTIMETVQSNEQMFEYENTSTTTTSTSSSIAKFNQQSPQTSSNTTPTPIWGENWYVGEFRKDSNWRRGKYSTTVLRGHKEIVWSLLYESDTNTLISGSEDMTVKVWDCSGIGETHQYYDDIEDSKKRCIKTLGGHKNGTICLGSTPNRLISGSADGSVKIWDRFEGTCVETIQTHSSVWCLQIVNGTLICGCVDGTMRVFDLNTSSCLRTMRGHTAPVRCLQAINHNGQELVVSGSYDKTIKVWDMDARCINTIRAHTHKINCLQYENGQLVSGSHDSLLKVWDMNGQLIHTLQGHDNMIHCLQFKGNKLLSGSTDSTIRLWDLKTGTHVNTIKGQSAVCCLKFNDSKLITGYEDSTIKIFDFSY